MIKCAQCKRQFTAGQVERWEMHIPGFAAVPGISFRAVIDSTSTLVVCLCFECADVARRGIFNEEVDE